MAKTKAKSPARAKPGASPGSARVTILNLKGTREYKEWLEKISTFSHMPTATLIDVALADWAKRNGFSESPPKRQMR